MYKNRSLTLIEILITLSIVAVAFLPLTRLFSMGLEQGTAMSDINTARYLAQYGIEKTKNTGFTKAQLISLGDVWDPPLDEPPFIINDQEWRILRDVQPSSKGPLEVHVLIYSGAITRVGKTRGEPLADLVTLIEDLEWTGDD